MRKLTNEEFIQRIKISKPTIDILTPYTNTRSKIIAKCQICKYEWNVVANTLLNTECGCPNCNGNSKVIIENFIKELNKKDLSILEEIDNDNFNSKSNVYVQCNICGYKFKTSYNRVVVQGAGCAVCKNKRVLKGYNDIWTTHPNIAKLLFDKNDGYKYTFSSQKKVKWKCPYCNNIIVKTVGEVYKKGLKCLNCSDGISYPEKFVRNLLSISNIDFICQKVFDWSDKRKYDFYLPKQNMIIETHGQQHYVDRKFFSNRTLYEEQKNNAYKEMIAKRNGISYYCVLDCRKSNCQWIKKSIIQSDLLKICKINIDSINWDYIDFKSNNSLIHEVCELYNGGISIKEIPEILSISYSTCQNYLKIGSNNKMCDYNPQKAKTFNGKSSGIKSRKPILCITTNKKFKSIKEAAMFYEFSPSYLSNSIRNNKKYCGTDKNTNEKLQWVLL